MLVTLLGTAGWMPTEERETTCFAVRDDDMLLILDAGTGLRRLADERHADLVEGAREIHLLLTHYHLDHVCGLAYLAGVLAGRTITVHAAPAEVTGVDPEAALAGLLRRPYNPQDLKDLRHISVKPITDRTVVAGRTIRIRAQQHSDVSIAYRIEDDVVLATDTTPDPATADFAAGASLLLHEAWYSQKDFAPTTLPPGYASHSNVESVAALAKEAGVGCLVLIHLNPLRDESYYSSLATIAQRTFSRSTVRRDGDTIDTDHLSHRT